jgi:hypothetical protein
VGELGGDLIRVDEEDVELGLLTEQRPDPAPPRGMAAAGMVLALVGPSGTVDRSEVGEFLQHVGVEVHGRLLPGR